MHETDRVIRALDQARIVGVLPARIESIVSDSRRVQPGSMYVALRGQRIDGHKFVLAAVQDGASVVVVDHEIAVDAPQIVVTDTRIAISKLADAFYNRPSQALQIAGITGTNGKTTTTHLLRAILEGAGKPCGIVGTLGGSFGAQTWALGNTTPLALDLHAILAGIRDAGATAVAMEVSSHGLALGRVDDVRFAVAALTNITRDHLDFHGTIERYTAAKRRLFELAPRAVLNIDDPAGKIFAAELRGALTYALDVPADIRAEDLELGGDGSTFTIDGTRMTLALPGRFNVRNALAAIGIARVLGLADATIAAGLAQARAVPGRMERFGAFGIDAIVDYAHTPDALQNVLLAARETTKGKLVVVFGCGGERDPGKRAEMGAIASSIADRVIVTTDNPRSEDPMSIARAVAEGIRADIILDRRAAIRRAIFEASAGDTVIVAGKGHETYQIVGEVSRPFDDRDEVRAAFAERAHQQAAR